MWASQFKPNKNHQPNNHNILNDLLILIKSVLVVANDFLKLRVLDAVIDFIDRLNEPSHNARRPD